MDLYSAHKTALQLMDDHGLINRGWVFDFDRSKRRFGCCKYGKKVISLSYYLASMNDESKVRETILHEIAHAIAGPAAKHGPDWRKVAREIGCAPTRCYGSDVKAPAHNYIGSCMKGCVTIKRHRRRTLMCRLCGTLIAWKINRG